MSGETVEQLLKQLATPKLPEVAGLAKSLGTTLQKTSENPYWIVYDFELINQPWERGQLRLSQDGQKALLNLETRAEPGLKESDLNLSQWGEVKGIDPNPRIPPEGADTYLYQVDGVRLAFEFTHQSRLLRGVSLEWAGAG